MALSDISDEDIAAIMDELTGLEGFVAPAAKAAEPVTVAPAIVESPVAAPALAMTEATIAEDPFAFMAKKPSEAKADKAVAEIEAMVESGTQAEFPDIPDFPVEATAIVPMSSTMDFSASTLAATTSIATVGTLTSNPIGEVSIHSVSASPSKTMPGDLEFFIDSNEFAKDVRVTETTLNEAMMRQASLKAYYGHQTGRAEAQYARLKLDFEILEARMYEQHRKDLLDKGEKATEKMVEAAVKLDPRYRESKSRVIEAESILSINKSCVNALNDKRDMIIQMGADRREDMKGAVRTSGDPTLMTKMFPT